MSANKTQTEAMAKALAVNVVSSQLIKEHQTHQLKGTRIAAIRIHNRIVID